MRFWNAFGYIDPRQATAIATATEAAGYYGLAVPDHSITPRDLASPYPYSEDGRPPFPPETPWPDVFCEISAMAAVTSTLYFTTAVYIAPARPLHVVAHQVATAAVISENRVSLGVGVGWMQEDYLVNNLDFHNRGKRLDEMIVALRGLWQPGWVEFSGEYYNVPPCRLTPEVDEMIPIYVGGSSDVARHRTATLGDGWILPGPSTISAITEQVADMRRRAEEVGRSLDDVRIISITMDPYDLDFYRQLDELGVSDSISVPWTDGGSPLQSKLDDISRFRDEVIARFP